MNAEPHDETKPSRTILRISNVRSEDLQFAMEPWAFFQSMPPGAAFVIEAVGPPGDSLEVEYGEGVVTVYAWAGATARIYRDGTKIADLDQPCPPVPSGTSMSGMVNLLFGPASAANGLRNGRES